MQFPERKEERTREVSDSVRATLNLGFNFTLTELSRLVNKAVFLRDFIEVL